MQCRIPCSRILQLYAEWAGAVGEWESGKEDERRRERERGEKQAHTVY